MRSGVFPFLLPLFVLAFVAFGVIAIGTLLLTTGETLAIPVALLLTAGVTAACAFLSWRAGASASSGQ